MRAASTIPSSRPMRVLQAPLWLKPTQTQPNNQLSSTLLFDLDNRLERRVVISAWHPDWQYKSSLFCRFWASWWLWASWVLAQSTHSESSARLCKLSSAAVAVASMTWEPVRPEPRRSARLAGQVLADENIVLFVFQTTYSKQCSTVYDNKCQNIPAQECKAGEQSRKQRRFFFIIVCQLSVQNAGYFW